MLIYKNKQLFNKNRCIVRKKISNGVHFIGIGGIGISALAQYYLEKGHKISGSDLVSSEITESLRKRGVKIYIGRHNAKNLLKSINLIIYSPAVQSNNPELKKARKLGIKYLSYPQALGELTKEYFTIAVSGTHGKSTTTTMIGLLLVKAGLNPTVIVGTKVKEFGDSNFRIGKTKYLVIEACEHEESFLNYFSDIAVITNIEPDHLDYFKNFNNVKKAFIKFTKKLKKNGILITEKKYKNPKDAKKLKKILKVSGEHNISNALAALTVARALKIPDRISFKALLEYKGCWRRFEIKKGVIKGKQITIVSDYAHHPTEVQTTLKTAREKYSKKRIWCVFQPHQYHRTHYLFNDFVKVFKKSLRLIQGKSLIDKLIITDIYDVAGREKKEIREKISSKRLVEAIKKNKNYKLKTANKEIVLYIPTLKETNNYLKKNLQGNEIIIIMGAGDIYKLKEKI